MGNRKISDQRMGELMEEAANIAVKTLREHVPDEAVARVHDRIDAISAANPDASIDEKVAMLVSEAKADPQLSAGLFSDKDAYRTQFVKALWDLMRNEHESETSE